MQSNGDVQWLSRQIVNDLFCQLGRLGSSPKTLAEDRQAGEHAIGGQSKGETALAAGRACSSDHIALQKVVRDKVKSVRERYHRRGHDAIWRVGCR